VELDVKNNNDKTGNVHITLLRVRAAIVAYTSSGSRIIPGGRVDRHDENNISRFSQFSEKRLKLDFHLPPFELVKI